MSPARMRAIPGSGLLMKIAVSSRFQGRGKPLAWQGHSTLPAIEPLDFVAARPRPASASFGLLHFWIPVGLLLLATLGLMVLHGDLRLTDQIYAWEGQRWAFKNSYIAQHLIHESGRRVIVAAWLGVLAMWGASHFREGLAGWRRPLAYLLLSVALSTLAVAWVKAWSNMDCPWDLAQYGGSKPYVDLFSLRPLGLERGRCFPAGHASAGYAWMSLYFFFLLARPRWSALGLAVGVGLGLLFGIDQQLRGAHFASHDVWAAGICWMVSLGLYLLFRGRRVIDTEPRAVDGEAA